MLYEISDQVKSNILLLINALAQKGISLNEVGAIHEIVTVLGSPVQQEQK